MNYSELKKLDDETLAKMTEGIGPSDECYCSLLAPPQEEKGGIRQSIKKAFASIGQGFQDKKRWSKPKPARPQSKNATAGAGAVGFKSIDIPLTFNKGGKGIYSTKEAVPPNLSCSKCACEKENIVLKHSYANIRITSPDISSICPCPTDCLPDREKLKNNIKVTIENLEVDQLVVADNLSVSDGQSYSYAESHETLPQSENSSQLEEQDDKPE